MRIWALLKRLRLIKEEDDSRGIGRAEKNRSNDLTETAVGRLAGKTALITGASRGIGRAIAEAYGREGANVVVNYTANARAAQDVVAAIKSKGGEAVALRADVVDSAALRDLFVQAERAFDGLDIVVANAHPGLGHGRLTQLSDETVDQQLAVLKSFIITLQEAGRRVRDKGVIITISSAATRVAVPEVGLYASIKLAIEQLSRALSREVAPRGIRVMALAPGLTRTDRMIGASIPKESMPFTGPAEPDDIADVAVFLASNEARWVNTSTLHVNGGSVYAQ